MGEPAQGGGGRGPAHGGLLQGRRQRDRQGPRAGRAGQARLRGLERLREGAPRSQPLGEGSLPLYSKGTSIVYISHFWGWTRPANADLLYLRHDDTVSALWILSEKK